MTLAPHVLTSADGATLTFKVNNTAAFFIYGSMSTKTSNFRFTLTPPPQVGPPKSQEFNTTSRWSDDNVIFCFATGLNLNVTYDVALTNIVSGGNRILAIRSLQIMGFVLLRREYTDLTQTSRVPDSTSGSPSSASPLSSTNSRRGLTSGAIAGIVVCLN